MGIKKKFNTVLSFAVLLMALPLSVQAQSGEPQLEMVDMSESEFAPHWQLGFQLGAAADVGEARFADLISPALQFTTEYRFLPALGARFSLSGLWARNQYSFPKAGYKWNFIQPALELKLDLASLFFGEVPNQPVSAYVFAGGGVAYGFNNDDAVAAKKQFAGLAPTNEFEKLWKDDCWCAVARAGIGMEVILNDYLSLTGELNGNMLSDRFNSKKGKNDNLDWHFNALVGLAVNLGKAYSGLEPVFRAVNKGENTNAMATEGIVRDTVALRVNIQFLLNSSQLRSQEFGKLYQLLDYLRSHPKSHVEMTGYADRLTGTPTINERLSQERATVVANWLVNHGLDRDRIYKDAKGDRVQPFPINEDNRVTICLVVDLLD